MLWPAAIDGAEIGWKIRRAVVQFIAVTLMNIPILSYGMALGWVSLASGANRASEASGVNATIAADAADAADAGVVAAAATTFVASLLAAPLVATMLSRGRKLTVVAASAAFLVCWILKLSGGWWAVEVGRAAAGAAGAAAWAAGPVMTTESVSGGASAVGAAAAHNGGMLLMYLAAYVRLPHQTVLWWCAGLSAVHCVLFLLVPESPAFLAANGRQKEAEAAVAWLQATSSSDPRLEAQIAALPPLELIPGSLIKQTKDLLSERGRRRALAISTFAILGPEVCGVAALLQFAQRALSGEGGADDDGAGGAVLLGTAQLVASLLALPVLERVGRRPLLIASAIAVGACVLGAGWGPRGPLLAAAVAADALGVQTTPAALLADMFHYQYRGCAMLLATSAAAAGNAVEVVLFPLLARNAGLQACLIAAAAATFLYALVLAVVLPETRGRTVEEIYDVIAPKKIKDCESVKDKQCSESVKNMSLSETSERSCTRC